MELQFQHQSFNEYSGLISFRIDWLDLLAVPGVGGRELFDAIAIIQARESSVLN